MFEKFLSQNQESFRQRYEGTYGFYSDGRKRLLVKLAEISTAQCAFVDADGVSYRVRPDHPDKVGFEFLPPKSAWYNTEQWGAVYTQRLAQRQFQRGITSKNVELLQLAGGDLHPRRLDFHSLSAIYEHNVDPKTAFKGYASGRVPSIAISSQFAIDLLAEQIRVLKEPIGSCKWDKKTGFTFKLTEPQLWRTEITDAITGMGCTADIS